LLLLRFFDVEVVVVEVVVAVEVVEP